MWNVHNIMANGNIIISAYGCFWKLGLTPTIIPIHHYDNHLRVGRCLVDLPTLCHVNVELQHLNDLPRLPGLGLVALTAPLLQILHVCV